MLKIKDWLAPDIWRSGIASYATTASLGRKRWIPYLWLLDLARRLLPQIVAGDARIIVNAPPRHGKALEINTPIPTPEGWKKIGNLREGDFVFDSLGQPTKVIAVSAVFKNRTLYRISGKEVAPIFADEEHEWKVRLDRKYCPAQRRYCARTIRTSAYLASRTSLRRPLIDLFPGLILPEQSLPIDPWVLGFWLGDGRATSGFVTIGEQDREEVLQEIVSRGFAVRGHKNRQNWGVLGLQKKLRLAGLVRNKHIPAIYLRAARGQRLALLQGLIDSDGHVAPDGQVEFCSTNGPLAEQVAELVRTFGVKCTIIFGRATLYGKDCGPKFRVMFYMKDCARLRRKAERTRNGEKQPGLYIDVKKTETVGETVCIQVDSPTHMFLAGLSMVPTHNSELVSHWLPTWFIEQWPRKQIILSSYGGEFAGEWGKKVRDEFMMNSMCLAKLRSDSRATESWMTTEGGGMKTAGVGGPITGRGADLCFPAGTLIDTKEGARCIEDIRADDFVLAFDHEKNEIVSRRVVATKKTDSSEFTHILTFANKCFRATPEHKVFSPQCGYVSAKSLHQGALLLSSTNTEDRARHVVYQRKIKSEPVYDARSGRLPQLLC